MKVYVIWSEDRAFDDAVFATREIAYKHLERHLVDNHVGPGSEDDWLAADLAGVEEVKVVTE